MQENPCHRMASYFAELSSGFKCSAGGLRDLRRLGPGQMEGNVHWQMMGRLGRTGGAEGL